MPREDLIRIITSAIPEGMRIGECVYENLSLEWDTDKLFQEHITLPFYVQTVAVAQQVKDQFKLFWYVEEQRQVKLVQDGKNKQLFFLYFSGIQTAPTSPSDWQVQKLRSALAGILGVSSESRQPEAVGVGASSTSTTSVVLSQLPLISARFSSEIRTQCLVALLNMLPQDQVLGNTELLKEKQDESIVTILYPLCTIMMKERAILFTWNNDQSRSSQGVFRCLSNTLNEKFPGTCEVGNPSKRSRSAVMPSMGALTVSLALALMYFLTEDKYQSERESVRQGLLAVSRQIITKQQELENDQALVLYAPPAGRKPLRGSSAPGKSGIPIPVSSHLRVKTVVAASSQVPPTLAAAPRTSISREDKSSTPATESSAIRRVSSARGDGSSAHCKAPAPATEPSAVRKVSSATGNRTSVQHTGSRAPAPATEPSAERRVSSATGDGSSSHRKVPAPAAEPSVSRRISSVTGDRTSVHHAGSKAPVSSADPIVRRVPSAIEDRASAHRTGSRVTASAESRDKVPASSQPPAVPPTVSSEGSEAVAPKNRTSVAGRSSVTSTIRKVSTTKVPVSRVTGSESRPQQS